MNVFLSWAGADRDVKNVIADRLRAENIDYWESDEHCVSDFSNECIGAIKNSSVFIVIVSKASMDTKSYVFNEVLAARQMENDGRLNILVYKICDEPYTDRFEMQLNHISDANHVARIKKLNGNGAIDNLVGRVKYLLKKRRDGDPEKPYDVSVPLISGTSIVKNGYFVEGSRREELENIDRAFENSNIIILSGLYGFGKKTIIRKYAELQNEHLISATEVQAMHDNMHNFFSSGFAFTNINDGVFENCSENEVIIRKIEMLKKLDQKHLIVIENINLNGEPDSFIVSALAGIKCRIVFITQGSAETYSDYYPVISVGAMTSENLCELFYHHYNRAGDFDKNQLAPHLFRFFETVGGHTKTVEITSSVLSRELGINPENLPEYLETDFDEGAKLQDRIVSKLTDIFELESFTQDESKALLLASLMASPYIDEKTYRTLLNDCNVFDYSCVSSLDSHRWLSYNPRNRTIFIEPVIAKICVKKLLDNYEIPHICMDYMMDLFTDNAMGKYDFVLILLLNRIEQLLRLLQLNEAAEVVRAQRLISDNEEPDTEYIEKICADFEAKHSQDNYTQYPDDEKTSDAKGFEKAVAQYVSSYFLPAVKLISKNIFSQVYSFDKLKNLSADDIASFSRLFDEESDVKLFQEAVGSIEAILNSRKVKNTDSSDYDEYEIAYITSLAVIDKFYKRDFGGMMSRMDKLLDFISENPMVLDDIEVKNLFFCTIKLIYVSFENSKLYQSQIMYFEKLLAMDWPVGERYSLLTMYGDIFFRSGISSENFAYAMEEACEIFDEAMQEQLITPEEKTLAKKILHIKYAFILANSDDIAAASEIFEKALAIDENSCLRDIVNCADAIIKQFMCSNSTELAAQFIKKHNALFEKAANDTDIHIRETAEQILTVEKFITENSKEDFEKGGISENPGYYQKYSSDMGNNRFAMMKYKRVADSVKAFDFSSLSDKEISEHTQSLRERAQKGEAKLKLAPEAYALVSEAGVRVLGYRHHSVQYLGAAIMADGKFAEILNGEGKTYTIILVAYLFALYGEKVFIIDDSKYLTSRNFKWMQGVFELLGIKSDIFNEEATNQNIKKVKRGEVFYSTYANLGFAILHNETASENEHLNFDMCSIIVDEADNILIDCADNYISLTGPTGKTNENSAYYNLAYELAIKLKDNSDCYEYKNEHLELKSSIYPYIEQAFGISYENIEHAENIREAERLTKLAIYRCNCCILGRDYFIKDNKFYFENESSGAFVPLSAEVCYFLARLHGLDERKHLWEITHNSMLLNKTSVRSLFKNFSFVCGTSATVTSFKKELKEFYGFDVMAVPPALPVVRKDKTVSLYISKKQKDTDIIDLIEQKHRLWAQPIILITPNIKESTHFSMLLNERGIPHKLLNAQNSEESPNVLSEAGMPGAVLVTTSMANRGVDIKLGGNAEQMTSRELVEMGIDISELDKILYRLPSEETMHSELYKAYIGILTKNKALVSANKEKVIQAGGLCVIGSEPSDDMRVEQQIRGRSGRQGECGESYIFESMDDTLFENYIPDSFVNMVKNMCGDDECISSKMLSKAVEKAKKKRHHARYSAMLGVGNTLYYIEKGKEYFLAQRWKLLNGKTSFLDYLKWWSCCNSCADVVISVLKGEKGADSFFISELIRKYPQFFSAIKPNSIAQALYDAAILWIDEYGYTDNEDLNSFLAVDMVRAWQDHLNYLSVDSLNSTSKVKMSKHSLEKKYEADMESRMIKAIEEALLFCHRMWKAERDFKDKKTKES